MYKLVVSTVSADGLAPLGAWAVAGKVAWQSRLVGAKPLSEPMLEYC